MTEHDRPLKRPWPQFLEPWQELNGTDFGPLDFLNQPDAIPYVVAAQWLFCPEFTTYRGLILLADRVTPDGLPAIDNWIERLDGESSRIESICNLTTLYDIFISAGTAEHEDDLYQLAGTIAQCWRGLLRTTFPGREFVVAVHDDESSYGPQITFHSKPHRETPAADAIVVHDVPAGQPAATESTGVSLHVDLPPSAKSRFAELSGGPGGVLELNLRTTGDLAAVRTGLAPGSETLTDALRRCGRSGVLLTGFEQFWVRNRTAAQQLAAELPAAIATARDAGRTQHVALADLATDTAEEVVDLMRTAHVGGEPVPVFHYAPSA